MKDASNIAPQAHKLDLKDRKILKASDLHLFEWKVKASVKVLLLPILLNYEASLHAYNESMKSESAGPPR